MLSPLELKNTRLERLDIRVNTDWSFAKDRQENYKVDLDTDVQPGESPNSFFVAVGFKLSAEKDCVCRFQRIEIRLSALFTLPPDTDEKLVKTLVPLNCYAILYGIARGIVGQSTGFVEGGPLVLPAVNFQAATQKRKRARSAKAPSAETE